LVGSEPTANASTDPASRVPSLSVENYQSQLCVARPSIPRLSALISQYPTVYVVSSLAASPSIKGFTIILHDLLLVQAVRAIAFAGIDSNAGDTIRCILV
jgi:hypothetical protein